ncbi:PIN domain-containing protein [Zunongwangia endophytica]|uniref:PIN domain-containing protein n=1 Tax=Zunongwangia endophytica TaxID=1808945 RepID=A0ABV8H188_9FLAO|nr:PIN domain-containing protein [Zunongwangia endophytica]MDN3594317.1 PIN domain-containing protein [Zunongwangia endophytica]
MKELFPGYSRKTESDIKNIWKSGIIAFDANVLLNLYRYSNETKNTILHLISKFSQQIFLPYQSALEYNRNRYEVIAEQEKAYKEFLGKITQIQKDLQTTNKPPFLSQKVDEDLNTVFENVNSEVEVSIKKYCDYLKEDPVYDEISNLFKGKISEKYNQEKLEEVFKEGESRYKNKIPPGYEDEKTKKDNRKYGDLVLWNQIIDIAKTQKKNVILITDERKIDWWWKIKDGRNMGPRQELVEEIYEKSGMEFHMYSSEKFLSYGQTFLKEQINKQALNEIMAMKKAEMEEIKKIEIHKKNRLKKLNFIKNEIVNSQEQLDELNYVIRNMDDDLDNYSQQNIAKYYEGEKMDKEIPEHYRIMMEHKKEMETEREMLQKRLSKLKHNYINYKRNN